MVQFPKTSRRAERPERWESEMGAWFACLFCLEGDCLFFNYFLFLLFLFSFSFGEDTTRVKGWYGGTGKWVKLRYMLWNSQRINKILCLKNNFLTIIANLEVHLFRIFMPIFVLISSKHFILSSWHVCLSYMCMCVCMFACVGAHVCVHVHLEGHFGSGIFLRCPPPLKLRQEHSLNSDLMTPASVTGMPCPCLSGAGVTDGCFTCLAFTRVLGIQTPARRLVWQMRCQLGHLLLSLELSVLVVPQFPVLSYGKNNISLTHWYNIRYKCECADFQPCKCVCHFYHILSWAY